MVIMSGGRRIGTTGLSIGVGIGVTLDYLRITNRGFIGKKFLSAL